MTKGNDNKDPSVEAVLDRLISLGVTDPEELLELYPELKLSKSQKAVNHNPFRGEPDTYDDVTHRLVMRLARNRNE